MRISDWSSDVCSSDLTTIGTLLFTWLRGELVGRDGQGNRYYRAKGGGRTHRDSLRREQRRVIYEGEVEASRVPPEWHGWLHHTKIGRASCRERVCPYVSISVVPVSLKTKTSHY